MKSIFNFIFKRFTKVQIAFIIALIVFAFFISDSNLYSRFAYDAEIRDLNEQIDYYNTLNEENERKLNELKSSKENVEKFARENYYMKKANEDVFIIEDNNAKK